MTELINPLILPVLSFLGGPIVISIILSSIISLLYRRQPEKAKKTWLKLGILFILILIFVATGSLGKWGLLPVTLFLAYWGWLELLQCIERKYGQILNPTLMITLGMVGTLGGLWGTPFTIFFGVVITTWLALSIPMLISRQPPTMYSILGAAFGMVFITMPLANLLALVNASYGAFCFLILLVMGNDGFSQGFGMIGGTKPLAPNISPGKTWVGAWGGLLSCFVIGYLLRFLVPEWQLWQVMLISGGVSLMALCGDLIASSLKREAGIKDFGQVLAVTGGILDKFDSVMFAIPIFYFACQFIGISQL